jgi:hypothetical protein
MPGAYFKRWAAEAGRQISECIHSPVRAVQRKMVSVRYFVTKRLSDPASTSEYRECINFVYVPFSDGIGDPGGRNLSGELSGHNFLYSQQFLRR